MDIDEIMQPSVGADLSRPPPIYRPACMSSIDDHGSHTTPLRIGLIGDPVDHSYSPRFQQAALDALGIAARYELWQTSLSELPARIASLREGQYLGANITIPHKEAVLPLMDTVDPLAERIGAVNTIVQRDGHLHGYNTDAPGLLHALAEQGIGEQQSTTVSTSTVAEAIGHPQELLLHGYTTVLLGAGGAARSAAFALAGAGVARLIIVNRHLERAQSLAADVQQQSNNCQIFSLGDASSLMPQAPSLIINATSLGMHVANGQMQARGEEAASPLAGDILARFAADTLVFDMVYNPRQTQFLRLAHIRGLRAVNGLPMLLHQGAIAFTLWTGKPAPLEVMRASLL